MRYAHGGRFVGARPMRVVEDGADHLVAWLAPGTPVVVPSLADGRPIRAAPLERRFLDPRTGVPDEWRGQGILKLVPRDGEHSVWLFWDEHWRFWGWYVNVEARHRFWAGGVDTVDHVLDLWVGPDRSWGWKDEDELRAAVAQGAIDAPQAAAIRAEGERVARLVERWESPFRDGWERWRPDPAWPVPRLPDGWADA